MATAVCRAPSQFVSDRMGNVCGDALIVGVGRHCSLIGGIPAEGRVEHRADAILGLEGSLSVVSTRGYFRHRVSVQDASIEGVCSCDARESNDWQSRQKRVAAALENDSADDDGGGAMVCRYGLHFAI